MARSRRRTALFYDAPLATPEDVALVKGMLLFFDDIAVFSTPTPSSFSPPADHHLCAPLVERGLLQFVAPQHVTRSQTETIVRATLHRAAIENAEHWLASVAAGDWDIEVPRLQGRFAGAGLVNASESSASRLPGSFDLLKFLAQDGLLLPDESTDEEWIVVPGLASVANSILAQAVRTTAGEQGWCIEPVATRRDEAKVFTALLEDALENVGAADVVTSDVSAVTLDLSRVGLDDILDSAPGIGASSAPTSWPCEPFRHRLRRRPTWPIAEPPSWMTPIAFGNSSYGAGRSSAWGSASASSARRGPSGAGTCSAP